MNSQSQEEDKVQEDEYEELNDDIEQANIAAAQISTTDLKPKPPAPKRRNVNRQQSNSNVGG